MPTYQVRLATTVWHFKTIQADTPEQATDIAFGDCLDIREWDEEGLGESEFYETIKIKE